jgi:flagellar hook-associated protein 2
MAEPIGTISGLASGIQWRDMIDQIMQMESARRLSPVTSRSTAQSKTKDAWATVNALLGKVSDAADSLRDGSAFSAFTVAAQDSPTSSKALLTAATTTGANPGTYQVEVRALARQSKLRGDAVASSSTALGYSGTFSVNGVNVSAVSTDTLASLRDKINAANTGTAPSGVTATIVDVSATEHYLMLTSDATGTNGVQLTDGGNVLGSLGVSTGSSSAEFSSDVTSVAQMLGLPDPPAIRTIVIDGKEITVDLQNDTLQSLLAKIDAAGVDVELTSGTDGGGSTVYSLDVHGDVWGKSDDADTQAVLDALGFTRANQAAEGTDARVRVDGLDVVRSSNTIDDALSGITLSLKNAEVGTTVDVTVARDLGAIKSKVEALANAFNSLVDYQATQRMTTAPLYANSSLRGIVSSLKSQLIGDVAGVDKNATVFSRLGAIGVEIQKDGKLEVDADKLESVLGTNFSEVEDLFRTHGSSSDASLTFVTEGAATATGSYSVEITQVATTASQAFAFSGPYSDSGSNANTLTILDAYSGKTSSITLEDGDDAAAVTTKLQTLFDDEGMSLSASTDGTNLTIAGLKYGSTAGFTVSYSRVDGGTTTQSAMSSPIGFTEGSYAGLDVVGKIYTAGGTVPSTTITGNGQLLTSDEDGDGGGLSIQYTGTTTGLIGTVSFMHGAAGDLEKLLDGYTRAGDGLIALTTTSLDDSIAALQVRQDDIQGRLDRYQQSLVKQWTAMETALSKLQSQGSWLASQIGAMQASQNT